MGGFFINKNIFKMVIINLFLLFSMAYNAQAKDILAVANWGNINIWDISDQNPQNWQRLQTLSGDKNSINTMAWNKNGTHLASGSSKYGKYEKIRIWDTSDYNPKKWNIIKTLKTKNRKEIKSLEWNHNGSFLAFITAGTIKILDTRNWKKIKTLTGKKSLDSAVWNPKGTRLAAGTAYSKYVTIWNTSDHNPQNWRIMKELKTYGESLAWSPDGKYLACTDYKTIKIWNLSDKKPNKWQHVKTLKDGHWQIISLRWNRAGTRLVSGEKIWDTSDQNPQNWKGIQTRLKGDPYPYPAAWNTLGTRLALIGEVGGGIVGRSPQYFLSIWDSENWKKMYRFSLGTSFGASCALFKPEVTDPYQDLQERIAFLKEKCEEMQKEIRTLQKGSDINIQLINQSFSGIPKFLLQPEVQRTNIRTQIKEFKEKIKRLQEQLKRN